MNEKMQTVLTIIFVTILLVGASDWALSDMNDKLNDETSKTLRECGINPMNGEYIRPNFQGK